MKETLADESILIEMFDRIMPILCEYDRELVLENLLLIHQAIKNTKNEIIP